jgi:hypothetical protein
LWSNINDTKLLHLIGLKIKVLQIAKKETYIMIYIVQNTNTKNKAPDTNP